MYGGLSIDNKQIKGILVGGNYVTAEALQSAIKKAKTTKVSVLEQLALNGSITKDLLGQAMAEFYKIPYADLNSNMPTREQVLKISESVAKKRRVVLFSEQDKQVIVCTDKPKQKQIVVELKKLFPRKKISIAFSLPEDIDAVFVNYRKALDTRFSKIIKKDKRIAPEILDEIISDAVSYNSSDIHLEPQEKEVLVRFRVDGVLQEAGHLPKEYYDNILNRIKVQSNLRIDEHFAAQDGSVRHEIKGQKIDMRVSIAPTLEGEKITIRLLSQYISSFSLTGLGFSARDYKLLMQEIKKPFGMIIVTGPTGSGKTSTLYSILKILKSPEVNITTIEDPVEYKILGINQIQVNERTNLTFADGLRSIVRQDPDIILVGEIRDEETAEISVNAALTGHLLLTTFHANNAASTVPRLLDMDIEPFLLSSTLEVIIAQRLVRKICEKCRYSLAYTAAQLKERGSGIVKYFKAKNANFYEGKGCSTCNHTGFAGRIAIFEIMQITPEIKELIIKSPSAIEMARLAQKQGMKSLFEDGVDKVKSGITSLDELLRVAQPPEINKV